MASKMINVLLSIYKIITIFGFLKNKACSLKISVFTIYIIKQLIVHIYWENIPVISDITSDCNEVYLSIDKLFSKFNICFFLCSKIFNITLTTELINSLNLIQSKICKLL